LVRRAPTRAEEILEEAAGEEYGDYQDEEYDDEAYIDYEDPMVRDGYDEYGGWDEDPWSEDEYGDQASPSNSYRFGFPGEVPGQDDEEPIGSRDTRVWVPNTKDAPFRYICNFEYDFPGHGRWGMCTGTLIGPRSVLTAGHCVVGRTASRLRIVAGRQGSSEPLPATVATKIIPAPGYRGSSPTDYAIVHLANPIGRSIGWWGYGYRRTKLDRVGTSMLQGGLPRAAGRLHVNVSGYPADKPGNAKYGCWDRSRPRNKCRHTLLGTARRNRACGTVPYRSYDRTTLLRGGMLHYLNDTCPGHSGSPVWVRRHPSKGGRVLVGVHVARDDGIGVKANRAVFLSASVRAFIRRHRR
jgi:V8-like Glu-specific endopeptidase